MGTAAYHANHLQWDHPLVQLTASSPSRPRLLMLVLQIPSPCTHHPSAVIHPCPTRRIIAPGDMLKPMWSITAPSYLCLCRSADLAHINGVAVARQPRPLVHMSRALECLWQRAVVHDADQLVMPAEEKLRAATKQTCSPYLGLSSFVRSYLMGLWASSVVTSNFAVVPRGISHTKLKTLLAAAMRQSELCFSKQT